MCTDLAEIHHMHTASGHNLYYCTFKFEICFTPKLRERSLQIATLGTETPSNDYSEYALLDMMTLFEGTIQPYTTIEDEL